jgi:alkanesulfonate monooxygenase SsuD/methylene tetrahydromethanopterin reductase-like flavin-dependent oxidoreductase (luciferase family)
MQFGVFTVGDVPPDPTTGRTPSEAERIKAMVAIARKTEEVGLDVFATGEHHNPPFVPSSPTTMLGYVAARTQRIILSTAITLITTNDPVKIAEDFAMLQHLADGRVDLMMGRGNQAPVYPWFGQDIRISGRASRWPSRTTTCCIASGERMWSTGRAGSGYPCSRSPPPRGDRRAGGLLRGTASSTTTSSGPPSTPRRMVDLYRRRFEHYGHGAADQAIVGLGGQVFMRRNSQDAVAEFRPYFDDAPVYGGGPSLEEFTEQTPLTVGSPQEVIDRTLTFREYVGDYQRQLFLMDHAGLPLKTVLEQPDMLGEESRSRAAQGPRRAAPTARPGRADARRPPGSGRGGTGRE